MEIISDVFQTNSTNVHCSTKYFFIFGINIYSRVRNVQKSNSSGNMNLYTKRDQATGKKNISNMYALQKRVGMLEKENNELKATIKSTSLKVQVLLSRGKEAELFDLSLDENMMKNNGFHARGEQFFLGGLKVKMTICERNG